jgi:hypothetical protein
VTGEHDLTDWTPIAVGLRDGEPVIRWCFTEGIEFTDPFFDQTIDRALQHPFRLLFWRETGIAELVQHARAQPGLAPSGFIFHMSRCGSTLITQMLAALPEALVMSEPGPLDALIRAGYVDHLPAMLSALGQRRTPLQQRLVVKLDAWAILHLDAIRGAFPDTPCTFVYREPVEVIVSQLNHRGYHMVPGTMPGIAIQHDLPPEEYIAAVLGHLCEAAVAAASREDLKLVGYTELPDVVAGTIAPMFHFDVQPHHHELMRAAATRDAKNPCLPFDADTVAKQLRASDAIRAAAERHVDAAYRELRRLTR